MASIKDIKKRIGTVKNTQQTTRAMKMVSAAKLRRAQEAIQNQRPYAKGISSLIRKLSADESIGAHPLVARVGSHAAVLAPVVGLDVAVLAAVVETAGQVHAQAPVEDAYLISGESAALVKKTILVLVTSDRGLCGGFNSNVIKAASKWMNAPENKSRSIEMAFVGRRGHDFFKNRPVKIAAYYPESGGKVSFQKAKFLANSLVERFQKGDVEEIRVIYNEFKNAATQEVVVENFLPLRSTDVAPVGDVSAQESTSVGNFIVKPGAKEVFGELVARNFSIQCFRILLESQAGEHGARMSAMENATKNAGEMIQSLTLQYNKQRQAGITKELLEIISGSESQKG